MIEDNIRVLRQAARITSNNDYEIEKSWCLIAGNTDLVSISEVRVPNEHKRT